MNAVTVRIDKKIYPDNKETTIDDLSFSAKKGEFVAIVGPSGSGKTTLLNIIAGIDNQFEGDVSFKDNSRTNPTLSFMFQDARLLPWLTVQENIELVLDKTPLTNNNKIHELLLKVNLNNFSDKYPNQLSGGMQRRVSMVRAFIANPELLLMDEPFQSLDEPTADELRLMLLELWRDTQATILFVTHSLREALALADRIIFLSHSPANIIYDYIVELERPRQLEDLKVNELHSKLLKQYPNLLSGSLDTNINDSKDIQDE